MEMEIDNLIIRRSRKANNLLKKACQYIKNIKNIFSNTGK